MTKERMPEGYDLKSIPSVEDYFFIDGCCGYQVSYGKTKEEAIENALEKINKERIRCNDLQTSVFSTRINCQ